MTKLQQLHEDIYSFLMECHKKNNDFRFFPRRHNKEKFKEKLWLTDNSDEILIGLSLARETYSHCLSLNIKHQNESVKSFKLQIGFRGEEYDDKLDLFMGLAQSILDNTSELKRPTNIEDKRILKFDLPFGVDWKANIIYFIEKIKPIIDSYIKGQKLDDTFFISEDSFKKAIEVVEIERHSILHTPILNNTNIPINSYPLNQILYGPPGTGKTYSTVELAYKIIHNDAPNSYEEARNWYKTALANTEDRQVEFITFHQNYSYEDFVMGIKPQLSEDTLGFREHKGIFFEICQRALKNLQQATQADYQETPSFQEVFDTFIADLIQNDRPVEVGLKRGGSFSITKVNAKNIEFKKQSGTSEHTLSIQTLEEIYSNQREFTSGLATYYNQIVEKLREIATGLTRKIPIQPLRNFVIIIDEINRANISRVFGELITLIEEDKRWGNEFETEVRLPDGVTKFTVPKNLYIIGTMNTADKSIALLDIALRRRFEFTALYPDSSKVSPNYQTFFESLNEQIIAKKGIDFSIGHSYFMTKNGEELDFVKTMNKKVIPLLNEYFYNAKDNKLVADLVEKAIAKAGFTHTIVPSSYQLLIQ
ncbi:McrB family protein [Arcicella rosea]|uniref:AAA+ ATPase domain-containing protein n=1 Tax=Arcicella rosea TaxID=502909 RepID=A0A841EKG5_9BACT|nr:AAA family ATPase [Arcicella rosea]MBB6004042.1 hypothetical protein [Arcicella rosea]